MFEEITLAARQAMQELLAVSQLSEGSIVVIGCSSSEIIGEAIGKGASPETADAVLQGVLPLLQEQGLYLAAQCCEHLNRALVIERKAAEKFGLEPVSAVPKHKAGGAFAAAAYAAFHEPVLVEHVRAAAGLDVGGTLIGMHLREVAVPLRLQIKKIGEAPVSAARTRPKYIGGPRTQYE